LTIRHLTNGIGYRPVRKEPRRTHAQRGFWRFRFKFWVRRFCFDFSTSFDLLNNQKVPGGFHPLTLKLALVTQKDTKNLLLFWYPNSPEMSNWSGFEGKWIGLIPAETRQSSHQKPPNYGDQNGDLLFSKDVPDNYPQQHPNLP
jgi:hypothetical protein